MCSEKRSRNFRRYSRPAIRPVRRQTVPVIDPNEWDFSSCPDIELNFCFLYEYTREASLNIAPRLREGVTRLRQNRNLFEELAPVALDLVGPGGGTWRLITAFPEWPTKPWLSSPPQERARRLAILFPDDYPSHTGSSAKDILPERLPQDFQARIIAAVKEYGLPVIPVGSGCWSKAEVELMKLKGEPIDWSKAELEPGEIPQIFLAVIMFHWVRGNSSLSASYTDMLKLLRPEDVPQDQPTKPAETSGWKSRYDLKALGAYRLLKRMSWRQAAALKSDGKPLYIEQGEWIKARRRAKEVLQEFGGVEAVYSTDT